MLFDHTYQQIKDNEIYENLLQRGFMRTGTSVNHPGQLTREFIGFRPEEGAALKYLEFFIHDPALPKDHVEFGKDPRDLWAGFSLRSAHSLEDFFAGRKEGLSAFRPKLEHKNYDWAVDNQSRLPGWNFLAFDNDPVPGIFIWVTEYEQRPNQSVTRPKPKIVHPNTARRIVGFVWTGISERERTDLQTLTGGSLEGDRLILEDGTWIQFPDSNEPLARLFERKTTRHAAVVIEVESLTEFNTIAKPDLMFENDGHPMAIIQLSDSGWDIMACEG